MPIFWGLNARGSRKLRTDTHTHAHTHGIVWRSLTPPSNIGKGSGNKRINDLGHWNFQTAHKCGGPYTHNYTCAAMAIIILNLHWVLAVATRYRELVIENIKSASCRAGDHNTDFSHISCSLTIPITTSFCLAFRAE